MEELAALCERRLPSITLSRNWEHFTQAKQLLAKYGYVEDEAGALQEQEAEAEALDEGYISFTLGEVPDSEEEQRTALAATKFGGVEDEEPEFTFPVKVPKPQYGSAQAVRSATGSAWKACPSLQIDASKHETDERLRINAQIPSVPRIVKSQKLGMLLVAQPFVKLDESQFYVKLRIDKFVVGVLPTDKLCEKKSLGFYPSFVKLSIEPEIKPEVESEEPTKLDSIVVYTQRSSEDEDACILGSTSSLRETRTSTTTIGGQIGYGPASIFLQQAWGTEREVAAPEMVKLVPIDALENGSAASFEWSILRWKHGARYKFDRPHSSLRRVESPQLPLDNGVAKVEGFPNALWRFLREYKDAKLQLRIKIQVHMHLVWFLGNMYYKALGFHARSFQFENVWLLDQPPLTL